MKLEIPQQIVNRIRDHGREAYPQECCGLLLGSIAPDARSVAELRPLQNAREDSRCNRYSIAPSDMLAAEKEASRLALEIIGVYHSHPDHPARPSEYDRAHALPWYSYVILSVTGGEPQDLMSWTLREDRSGFDVEELVVGQRESREVRGASASPPDSRGSSL